MIDEEILKKKIEGFIESEASIPHEKDKISDKLYSLFNENSSLKKKIYDARMADTETRRNLISEILEEVKHPILSSIFHEAREDSLAEPFSIERSNPKMGLKKNRYRKVIKCDFER